MLDVGGLLVPVGNIDDGAAVGDHEALEAPGLAEVLLEQHLVGAGGELIDGVVGAHHGLHLAFGDGGAKGGQIGLFEIARAGIDVDSRGADDSGPLCTAKCLLVATARR